MPLRLARPDLAPGCGVKRDLWVRGVVTTAGDLQGCPGGHGSVTEYSIRAPPGFTSFRNRSVRSGDSAVWPYIGGGIRPTG